MKMRPLCIAIFVDDCIIGCEDYKTLENFMAELRKFFEVDDLGELSKYLGMNVSFGSDGSITLSQKRHIEELLAKHSISPNPKVKTPLSPNAKLDAEARPVNVTQYKSMVGACLHLAVTSRPDMIYAACVLARYGIKPNEIHMKVVANLIKCACNTRYFKIKYVCDDNVDSSITVHAKDLALEA